MSIFCTYLLHGALCKKKSSGHIYTHDSGTPCIHCCCRCCQVASVVSDSVRPHKRQPTRLPCPWDSPGKNTGVGCHFLLQCMKVKVNLLSKCPTLRDPIEKHIRKPVMWAISCSWLDGGRRLMWRQPIPWLGPNTVAIGRKMNWAPQFLFVNWEMQRMKPADQKHIHVFHRAWKEKQMLQYPRFWKVPQIP